LIFQIPDYPSGYYAGISLILWFVAAGLMFLSAIILIIKSTKIEERSPKLVYLAYGMFYIFFGLTRIVYIIAVYNPDSYDFFTTLGYITQALALISILYVLETHIVKSTKKIFLIITIIAFFISVIALVGVISREFALTMLFILLPFSSGVILILYIYVIIKSTGTLRKSAIGLFFGSLMMYAAQIMDSEMFIGLAYPIIPLILEITAVIMIFGVIIFTFSQVKV
jgi:hypothetical protein